MVGTGLWRYWMPVVAIATLMVDKSYSVKVLHKIQDFEGAYRRHLVCVTGVGVERTNKETKKEISRYLEDAVKHLAGEVNVIAQSSFWRKSGGEKEQKILVLVHYQSSGEGTELVELANMASVEIQKALEADPTIGEIFTMFPMGWKKGNTTGLTVGVYVTESVLSLGTIHLERENMLVSFQGKPEKHTVSLGHITEEVTLPKKLKGLLEEVKAFCQFFHGFFGELEYPGKSELPRKWEYEGVEAKYKEEVDAVGPLGDLVYHLLHMMCCAMVRNANPESYVFPITVVLGPLEIFVPDRPSLG